MKGYAKLGWLMGTFPDTAVMRRFSALSAQNLLYLQAELTSLEEDLRKYAAEDDESSHPDRNVYSLNWLALKESNAEDAEEGNNGSQWETMEAIRNKLEQYRKEWMTRTDMGNIYLHGSDSTTWSNTALRSDLVALKAQASDDMFYRWIYDQVTNRFHRLLGHYFKDSRQEEELAGTVVYGEAYVRRLTKAVTTVLACMLPILSIVVLYLVQNMSKRLGIVTAFTAIFSTSLVVMTNAEMADIFAATAAYAAVQVVFIGTTGSVSNCNNCTTSS
ncbi:uncharacterized protein PAC_06327 [Phialocephala subalpina]|uniref:DUF6594 domain-containing protein n=1 Tax=Phialocephala subalpina TaxID=576137 RepID=A0A1L7WUJ5_9HELO|nr:uncharacterized protein PAC_06327 [Phialocephala subalpina]